MDNKHPKGASIIYPILIRPADWVANTVLVAGNNIIAPTVPNGCVYVVKSSGVTGDTEPKWNSVENSLITDNDVAYRTIPDTSYLREGDNVAGLVVTASSEDVFITQISYSNNALKATAFLAEESSSPSFSLFFKPEIHRVSGDTESPIFILNVRVQI